MADTTFTNGVTVTDADWFNDLNRLHYNIFGDPASIASVQSSVLDVSTTYVPITFPQDAPITGGVAGSTLTNVQTGSWTPSLRFGGSAVGLTTSNTGGRYVKINGLIVFSLYIALTNKGSSTGVATITLPFDNSGGTPTMGILEAQYMTTALPDGYWRIEDAGTVLDLYNDRSTTSAAVKTTEASFSNNSVIICTGSYFT